MKRFGRILASAAIIGGLVLGSASAPAVAVADAGVASVDVAAATAPAFAKGFNKKAKSITDPASYWVVVNKLTPLKPKKWVPKDLVTVPVDHVYAPKMRSMASKAVVSMFKAYNKSTGKKMQAQSAYRSYTSQVSVYNGWVKKLGKKKADLTSARPGFSEHQTGNAIDISAKPAKCSLQACFASTSQGKWLAKYPWKYGFVLRYPKGMTSTTGYEYEPWHYRHVGKQLAREMHDTKTKTLEQFFGLPKAPTYK